MSKRDKTANEAQNEKRAAWREREEYRKLFGVNPRDRELDHSEEIEWLDFWDSYDQAFA